MSLTINSNFAANTAQRNLAASNKGLGLALARLSAGKRVLAARDDAAALAIGSRLAAQITGLRQASVNAGQGSAILQVADGGMAGINDILARMKTLTIQAASDQVSAADRGALNTEFQALASEVDRIATDTEFAGAALLDGSIGGITFRVGTGVSPGADDITVGLDAATAGALSISGSDVLTKSGADAASAAIDTAIDRVQTSRAGLGAGQNRLEFAAANIATAIESTGAARSALIDLDVAQGISDLTANSLLVQTGIAMQAQANQQPRHLLDLLI